MIEMTRKTLKTKITNHVMCSSRVVPCLNLNCLWKPLTRQQNVTRHENVT